MVILKIAIRNLMLHKAKTAVIGTIIIFGTILLIVGNSFVDAIASGMKKSLINSITGDIQIYSKNAKDKLALYGGLDGTLPDIGQVSNFKKVRDTLVSGIDNIRTIVPMGTNFSVINPGNILDVKLEELRSLYKSGRLTDIHTLIPHIRTIVQDVANTFRQSVEGVFTGDLEFTGSGNGGDKAQKNLTTATSASFWQDFDRRHEERIEFLANKVAPLVFDDTMLALGYLGTVPQKFKEAFSLFEIVKGEMIPEGQRGYLFNDFIYETINKHRVARRLDEMKKQKEKNHYKISSDKTLKEMVNTNIAQTGDIYTQLNPKQTAELIPQLQKLTQSKKHDIKSLLEEFLTLTDDNFAERYQFFYSKIAPYLILYRVKIGDIFPVTAFTKAGYTSSVNVKVYGTYHFKGFESSPIAGNFDLIDMISFRDLYGFMTEERRRETRELEKEMGLSDAGAADIEALFSKGETRLVKTAAAPSGKLELPKNLGQRKDTVNIKYQPEEMEDGMFLNAAVILKDPKKADETTRKIQEISERENLGIQTATWIESAGLIGQLITAIRIVLYTCAFILFAVAAFIIMNSMLMATLERSREIGTMRAIGAQKSFVLWLFLNEAVCLSALFGLIGTAIGVTIIGIIGKVGIAGKGDVVAFFFSGPRLYLSLDWRQILIALGCMALVSVISTQYPAWRATRILPLEAMQKNE